MYILQVIERNLVLFLLKIFSNINFNYFMYFFYVFHLYFCWYNCRMYFSKDIDKKSMLNVEILLMKNYTVILVHLIIVNNEISWDLCCSSAVLVWDPADPRFTTVISIKSHKPVNWFTTVSTDPCWWKLPRRESIPVSW